MTGFQSVVGQEHLITYLRNALQTDRVSHAYIFSGEDGSGKLLISRLFAQALVCESGGADSCGVCHSCRQAASGNHPDIHMVTHEKPASISVEEIRRQVTADAAVKPYSSRYKIYIIDDAEKMTVQAQNALLKTIEEPPSYGIFLLLTVNESLLLPTVCSRCVTLQLQPVAEDRIREYLMREYQLPDYRARVCASFAQGNMGKAVRMAASADFAELHDTVLNLVKNVDDMDVYVMMDAIGKLSARKADIYDIIDMMMVWYRDVLMLKLTNDPNLCAYSQELGALSEKASKSTFEGLDTILKAMEKAKTRLRANVSFDTTLELLLLTIKEN